MHNTAVSVQTVASTRLTNSQLQPLPSSACLPPIDTICDIAGIKKKTPQGQEYSNSL